MKTEILKTKVQERVFLKEDENSLEGHTFKFNGVDYVIGDDVEDFKVLNLIPVGMGVQMTGYIEVREASSPLLTEKILLGIYYYRRLEGEACGVIDVIGVNR
jgi:hypothetical protein